jgi:predicted RNase H-like HicB family nuclease
MRYDAVLYESDEGFAVQCPALPGCWSQGATREEALDNIRDAIREYLSVWRERCQGGEVREVEGAV